MSRRDGAISSTRRVVLLALALLTVAAFWRVCTFDFVNDHGDGANLTRNADFNPPAARGVLRHWTGPRDGVYAPLAPTVWAGLARVARTRTPDAAGVTLNPYVFHAANLALHLGSACVLYAILRRLVRHPWAAGFGAMLFAVHPAQAQAVAWVSAMPDLLAGLASLAAVWFYLAFTAARRQGGGAARTTALAVAAAAGFVLGMLAKPSAAIAAPAMAVALDLLLFRQSLGRAAGTLAVALLLAVPLCVANRRAFNGEVVHRWSGAPHALAAYAVRIVLPSARGVPLRWVWPITAALALVAFAARRRMPHLTAAILVSALAFLPAAGGPLAYLAMAGPALALAAGLTRWRSRPLFALAAVLVVACAARASRQASHWRDDESVIASPRPAVD